MDYPFMKVSLANLFRKTSCDMYPAKPKEAPAGYRGRMTYDPTKCINCGMCERVCAGQAITRVSEKLEDGTELIHFTINLGSCTFCATCQDFCTHGALKLSTDFHMAVTNDEDLLVKGTCVKPPRKPVAKPAAPAAKPTAPVASAAPAVAPTPTAPATPDAPAPAEKSV